MIEAVLKITSGAILVTNDVALLRIVPQTVWSKLGRIWSAEELVAYREDIVGFKRDS